jgi:hypothetical protein
MNNSNVPDEDKNKKKKHRYYRKKKQNKTENNTVENKPDDNSSKNNVNSKDNVKVIKDSKDFYVKKVYTFTQDEQPKIE